MIITSDYGSFPHSLRLAPVSFFFGKHRKHRFVDDVHPRRW